MMSKRWSQGCGTLTSSSRLSPGWLPAPISTYPHHATGTLRKHGGDPYISASCLPPWPWDRACWHHSPAGGWGRDKKAESGKRGPLSRPPVTALLGSGQGRGASAQPPPAGLPCPARNVSSEAHQPGDGLLLTEGAVSCHPSPLSPHCQAGGGGPGAGWGHVSKA